MRKRRSHSVDYHRPVPSPAPRVLVVRSHGAAHPPRMGPCLRPPLHSLKRPALAATCVVVLSLRSWGRSGARDWSRGPSEYQDDVEQCVEEDEGCHRLEKDDPMHPLHDAFVLVVLGHEGSREVAL